MSRITDQQTWPRFTVLVYPSKSAYPRHSHKHPEISTYIQLVNMAQQASTKTSTHLQPALNMYPLLDGYQHLSINTSTSTSSQRTPTIKHPSTPAACPQGLPFPRWLPYERQGCQPWHLAIYTNIQWVALGCHASTSTPTHIACPQKLSSFPHLDLPTTHHPAITSQASSHHHTHIGSLPHLPTPNEESGYHRVSHQHLYPLLVNPGSPVLTNTPTPAASNTCPPLDESLLLLWFSWKCS